ERRDPIARLRVAEAAHGANQVRVAPGDRDLRLERVPVLADEAQRAVARVWIAEESCEIHRRVLTAKLRRQGQLQSAVDERRLAEVAERVEIAVLLLRRDGTLGSRDQRIEQRAVAVDRRRLHERARQ